MEGRSLLFHFFYLLVRFRIVVIQSDLALGTNIRYLLIDGQIIREF